MKSITGLSLFAESEVDEIRSFKQLASSMIQKATQVAEPIIWEGLRNKQKSAIEAFTNGL